MTSTSAATRRSTGRVVSLDAFRGLAVALMLLVNTPGLSSATPAQLRHAAWEGFTVADLVFPMFLLAVGMSIPLSRKAFQTRAMLKRVLILFAIGSLIVWIKYGQWFELTTGVLQFIALAYLAGWLMLRLPGRWPVVVASAALLALALLFPLTGGWDQDDNVAYDVDEAWLGERTDLGLLAMIAGGVVVVAGAALTRAMLADAARRRQVMLLWGVVGSALGLALWLAVPVIKRLWTPSFVVLAIGLSCLVLLLVDLAVGPGRRWATPLVDIGMNPLVVYVGITLADAIVLDDVGASVVRGLSPPISETVASVGWSVLNVVAAWAIAHALRRRSIFIRI